MAASSKVQCGDLENEQLLVDAASEGKLEIVDALLKSGTSVDAVGRNKVLFYASKNYLTPLHMACRNGHTKCVEALIANGADVNAADRFGVTAVHMAAEKGYHLCLRALLSANAECSAPTKYSKVGYYTATPYRGGTTPLHLAASNNQSRCVEELMQYGGDYNAVDELGRNSLYIAAQLGLSECVLAHLRNAVGRDILSLPSVQTGDTPLHFAVSLGMPECVTALLQSGSDPNHINNFGNSPLHLAVTPNIDNEASSFQILQSLVLDGCNTDVNQLDSCDMTAIHYVCINNRNTTCHRPEMAKFLLSHGANPSVSNKTGYSMLEFELKSASADFEVLKYLVRNMAQPPPMSKLQLLNQSEQTREFANLRERGMRLEDNYTSVRSERRAIARARKARARRVSKLTPLEVKQSWYESIASKPRTLQHYCRNSIRQALGRNVKFIAKLSVPNSIKSYLFLEKGD